MNSPEDEFNWAIDEVDKFYKTKRLKLMAGKSIWRGVQAVVAFLVPLLLAHFPEWANLTVGGILMGLWHFLEKKATA